MLLILLEHIMNSPNGAGGNAIGSGNQTDFNRFANRPLKVLMAVGSFFSTRELNVSPVYVCEKHRG